MKPGGGDRIPPSMPGKETATNMNVEKRILEDPKCVHNLVNPYFRI